MTNPILIIDAMNMFVRNYSANPSLDAQGAPFGGTKGFLMSLQKLTKEINPNQIVVIWDGSGGSKRRRALVKEYKGGRKPIRLNRAYANLSPDEETENRGWQVLRTIEYLNEMPVIQLVIDDVEADDVIAYVSQMPSLNDEIKIIVSMDKDFYQLCDDTTIVLRPIKNEYLNEKRIVEQFGIHPYNFALARAIDGDKSDNLSGVKGVGLKTIAKRFPTMASKKLMTTDALRKICLDDETDTKIYKDILSEFKKVKLNYKVMQLYTPYISPKNSTHIRETINNFEPNFNRTNVHKQMLIDGISDYNWNALFRKFRSLIADHKNYLLQPG